MYYDGEWGTVCDDGWSLQDAMVVCRQLGLGDAQEATQNARFGPGTMGIFLDDVGCIGTEDTLMNCTHLPVGTHNCMHIEDAGVICEAQGIIKHELYTQHFFFALKTQNLKTNVFNTIHSGCDVSEKRSISYILCSSPIFIFAKGPRSFIYMV